MENNSKTSFIEVFNGDYWHSSLIKQLLSEHDIPSFLRNELMGGLEPFTVVAGGSNPVSIEVIQSDYEKAVSLITEFNEAVPENE